MNEKCGELVRILMGLPERARICLISKLPTSLLPHALQFLDSEYKILIFILRHYESQLMFLIALVTINFIKNFLIWLNRKINPRFVFMMLDFSLFTLSQLLW